MEWGIVRRRGAAERACRRRGWCVATGALAAASLGTTCVPPGPPRQPESAPPARPQAAAPAHEVHVVGADESACALAGRYGVPARALRRANGLADDEALAPGMRLRLPSEPLRHRLARGETLWDVSHGYGVPVERVARENGIRDATRIPAGRVLRIPAGARTGCPPALRTARTAERSPAAAAPPPAAVRPPSDPGPPGAGAERGAPDRASLLAATRRLVDRARAHYDAADFESALELVEVAQLLLAPLAETGEAARLEARAAWTAGLAHTGLGQREPAVEAFRTALRLAPAPADAQSLSPKVRALVESARRTQAVSALD